MTLLTPLAALVVLAVALPLLAVALGVRRAAAVRAMLGLRAPRHGTDLVALAALVGSFVLLAVAATQPALAHDTAQRVRTDAQVLFVLDTSRSMAAARTPAAPTRLARAEAAAARLRASIPGVEAGIATLTDRVLPDLLPVADRPSFDATLARAVGIEQPPPRFVNVRATNCGALAAIPASGFFAPTARHRVIVVLTDGESRPFDAGALGRSLTGVGLVVVGVRRDGEAVFLPSGRPEPGYRSDPSAAAALATLAGATNGRAFGESDLRAASAKVQQLLGKGPTAAVVSRSRRETPLAPYIALAALVPLAFLARRRTAGPKTRRLVLQ
jgi:von Willebrand factor type A domain